MSIYRIAFAILALTLLPLTHPQELRAEEGETAQVHASTPTEVSAIPKARWELRLPGVGHSSMDGVILTYPSLAYFYRANRAVGLEGGTLASQRAFTTTTLYDGTVAQPYVDIRRTYVAVTHQWEKPIGKLLRPYLKIGPAMYSFHASEVFAGSATGDHDVTKWSPGLLTEAGLTLGWSRGIVVTLGYGVNTFYQPSLLGAIGSSIRGVPAARVSLGFRW